MKGYQMKKEIIERNNKKTDPDDNYILCYNARMQLRHIKHRALNNDKPTYNKYVKSFSRDVSVLLEEMIELMEFAIWRIDMIENGGEIE